MWLALLWCSCSSLEHGTSTPTDPLPRAIDSGTSLPTYDAPIPLPLAATARPMPAGASHVRTLLDDEVVWLLVEGPDAPVVPCDAFVTEAKSPEAWETDTALVDVRGGPQEVDFGPAPVVVALDASDGLPSSPLGIGYDVVLDCDRDGQLSPGDRYDAPDGEAAFYKVGDLTDLGPHEVVEAPNRAGTWLQQAIYYPADLPDLGQVPLVVVAHGFGHELTYYSHLGRHLASHGYVVASIRNNVGSGADAATRTAAATVLANTEYLLTEQATVAKGVLDGHLDADRIVWIGHSTGGECVVHAYAQLHDGTWSSEAFDTDSIALVSSLAPVAFLPRADSMPYDANYHLITGAADRDTANYPERGYTQNLALFERATGNRHLTWLHGAGHGDLHSGPQNWLDQPDPSAPDLFGPEGAHPVVISYHLALIEWYTQNNPAMLDFFERSSRDLRPSGIAADVVVATEYRPAPSSDRVVVDDGQGDGLVSSSGGAVTGDVANLEVIDMRDHDRSFAWDGQAANGMTRSLDPDDDARCWVFDWSTPSHLEFELVPELRDLQGAEAVTFRLAQGTRHPETVALGGDLSLTVTLRDESGTTASLALEGYGPISPPYQRPGEGAGAGWANAFETVRLPVADLVRGSALDLGAVEAIRLEVGDGFGSVRGRVAFDDLAIEYR